MSYFADCCFNETHLNLAKTFSSDSSPWLLSCVRQCVRSAACCAVSVDGGVCVMADDKGNVLNEDGKWWLLMCESYEKSGHRLYKFYQKK